MTPTTSVVLCTRNGERFLQEQLESISRGSITPDEVIILDDDSSDATLEIASRWATDSPRIEVRLHHNRPALGVVANFERGLRMAQGDVIVLSDQDDRWSSRRLEGAVEQLRRPGALLVHGDARLIDDAGLPLGSTLFDYLGLSGAERDAERSGRGFSVLLRRNTVTGATTALRRELLEQALPVPAGWIHDEWLAIIAAARGGLVLDDEVRIDYRLHGANQIGAERPTLAHRIRRAVETDPERLPGLARRATRLLDRLRELRAPEQVVTLAAGKESFERRRASMARVRLLRLPVVAGLALGGEYAIFASRGRWDIIRDLLQRR